MQIAKEVLQIAAILHTNKFKAYLVGGCLRDLLTDTEPKDWDIATDAEPEQVRELFPDSVYENSFGTVAIKTDSKDQRLKIIEVTTFRTEGAYSDKRRPDQVKFVKNIEEDLARRDFTVNAMAFDLGPVAMSGEVDEDDLDLIDPYDGEKDLSEGVIRAVGDAGERFREDALRLMRAVRFHAQLGFRIERGTMKALTDEAKLLEHIATERIRDELSKMLITPRASEGIEIMRTTGLLKFVLPELLDGVSCEQNQHHIYDVYEHNLKSLEYSASKNHSLTVRIAALLHDVGKPATREWKDTPNGKKMKNGKKGDWTFYNHQTVGAKMARKMLQRLHFSNEIIDQVYLLVYEHMFVYDPEVVTLAGVRRLLARVGPENIDALIQVREADRIGSGVPKAQPYRLRYLLAMIEKVKTDPISAKMLAINGEDLMNKLLVPPGRLIGQIIAVLLEEVLEDPSRNDKEALLVRAKELAKLSSDELEAMKAKAQEHAAKVQHAIDAEIKKKYFIE
jgi:poly(A) polymerase/tRNA nucleotidyltransferase (CCA-adding enzyme)